jgi:hypothetical protein
MTGGAFMVNVDLLNVKHNVMAKSRRPLLMKYKSLPVKIVEWIVFAPFYVFGLMDESQTHRFVLFDSYVEDKEYPLSHVRVWLSDPAVQVSSANVYIIAELSGLSYFMYHWFIVSAIVGTFMCWSCIVGCFVGVGSLVYLSSEEEVAGEIYGGVGAGRGGGVRRGRSSSGRRGESEENRGRSRTRRSRSPLNDQDLRGQEYIPKEERVREGFKEE